MSDTTTSATFQTIRLNEIATQPITRVLGISIAGYLDRRQFIARELIKPENQDEAVQESIMDQFTVCENDLKKLLNL
jgi:hypothetical protein